ncbi:MAG TPA: hypothetical protein ENI05_08985 [Porticoccus sp.]|nr:hypothetical protein [Porticoccus sp.]
MFSKAQFLFSRSLASQLFIVLMLCVLPLAWADETRYQFSIPSQDLSSALVDFSSQTNIDYVSQVQHLNEITAGAVAGELTASEALSRMLKGTKLTFSRLENGSILIKAIVISKAKTQVIEEVIVMVQKRKQPSQKTPLALSVFDGDELEGQGVNNTRDLFLVAPSVTYHGAITAAGQGVRIRGIGSGVIATGIEQSVGTIIDGVVTGPSGSGLQELWDVDRIEILRGPQGTLFGKNVSAGAINQITKDPTETFEAQVGARYEAEYDGLRLDGVVSGPINDELSYRVAAFDFTQDKGVVKNTFRNEEENNKDRSGIRFKLSYAPNDQSWAKFGVSYDKSNERCCARVFALLDEENASGFTLDNVVPALNRNNITPSDDNLTAMAEGFLYEKASTLHTVLELGHVYDSGHTLKSITGYRKWEHESQNDGDNLDIDIVSFVSDTRELTLFTQEVQWLSPEGEDLEYLLGAYYYNQSFPSTEFIGGGADFNDTNGTTTIDSEIDVENIAIFGHATYHFSPTLSAYGGLRLLYEEIDATGQQGGDNWIWPTDYPRNNLSEDDTDYVGVVGLQYFPDDDHQLYASVSRGYKGQAVDNSSNSIFYRAPITLDDGSVVTVADAVLKPETVVSVEVGSKSYFYARRLLFNTAVFYSEFSDFQSSAYDGNSNSFRLTNAGTVESQGVELDLKFIAWEGAFITGSAAWVDATFKEFKGAPCTVAQINEGSCSADTGGQDLSGKNVNETPEWEYNIGLQQAFYLDFGEAYFNVNYNWRDDVIFDGDLDPNTQQDAFGLLDLKLGLKVDSYEIAAFMNNATDENYAVRIIDAPIWRGAYQRYPGIGRTFGLEFRYRYE